MGMREQVVLLLLGVALLTFGLSRHQIDASQDAIIEMEAVRIADIVSHQVLADRAVYSKKVLGKLQRDGSGLGASRDHHARPGFVPLPAQFVRAVSTRVGDASEHRYRYSLISKWNLNEDQGLQDAFDLWAWRRLEAQDASFASQTPGNAGHPWRAVHRFEVRQGRRVLRYMRADPASASACVRCHNDYERRAEVQAYRRRQGTEVGRQWKLHQLMGAIQVDVEVEDVVAASSTGRNRLLWGIGFALAVGFGALFLLLQSKVFTPLQRSVRDLSVLRAQVHDLVDEGRGQLQSLDVATERAQSLPDGLGNEVVDLFDAQALQVQLQAHRCHDVEEGMGRVQRLLQQSLGQTDDDVR